MSELKQNIGIEIIDNKRVVIYGIIYIEREACECIHVYFNRNRGIITPAFKSAIKSVQQAMVTMIRRFRQTFQVQNQHFNSLKLTNELE